MLVRIWSNWNSPNWWECKGIITLEKGLAVSYKVKHTPTLWLGDSILGNYLRKMKAYTPTSLLWEFWGSFIQNSAKLETIQKSINRRMDKQTGL